MNGFNVSESGHVVQLIPPKSSTGEAHSQCFNFGKAEHASIIITLGAITSLPTAIQVMAASTAALAASGSTAAGTWQPMPFRYYVNTTAGTSADLTSPPQMATAAAGIPVTAAGLTATTNTFVIIEMDSAEIDYLGDSNGADYPYVFLVTTSGNCYISAVAILSGVRWQYQGGQTVTT